MADIKKTQICPLAKAVRKGLKEMGIPEGVKVVYSTESPVVSGIEEDGKLVPASVAFVPGAAGLMLAAQVFRDLAGIEE